MVEHTSGPWIARRWWEQVGMTLADADGDEREVWASAPYVDIYSTSAGVPVTACHDLAAMSPMDAALLAGAPALLAALENMVEWLDRTGESRSAGGKEYEYVTEARAAVARAREVSA